MISLQRIEQQIPALTAGLVVIIAGSAFCLSFYNLQLQAIESGINLWLSWLWPLCLDALLVAGSLMVLRSSLRGEPALVGWSVLLAFTGISTFFNVIHSPEDIISRLAHAVPPVALCVSIEILMLCIKSDLQQQVDGSSSAQSESIDPDNVNSSSRTVSDTAQRPDPHLIKRSRRTADANAKMVYDYFLKHNGATLTVAAKDLGLSRGTVRRHLNSMSTATMVHPGDDAP